MVWRLNPRGKFVGFVFSAVLVGLVPASRAYATPMSVQGATDEAPAAQRPSICQAIALRDSEPPLRRLASAGNGLARGAGTVDLRLANLAQDEVRLTYVTHSTYLIETAGGLQIATDYAGFAGFDVIPDVVTMNHAHETHYTNYPDPGIDHVFRGWNPDGGPARHDAMISDVRVRNVPTNIRRWEGGSEIFGNSIFVFEVAGLCIGHLGHLHHELTNEQIAQIGQLDVVMVPVDGTFTLDHAGMLKVLASLSARVVLPMHWFSPRNLEAFVEKMSPYYAVAPDAGKTLTVSRSTLPDQPTVFPLRPF